jgi:hypothetical protein
VRASSCSRAFLWTCGLHAWSYRGARRRLQQAPCRRSILMPASPVGSMLKSINIGDRGVTPCWVTSAEPFPCRSPLATARARSPSTPSLTQRARRFRSKSATAAPRTCEHSGNGAPNPHGHAVFTQHRWRCRCGAVRFEVQSCILYATLRCRSSGTKQTGARAEQAPRRPAHLGNRRRRKTTAMGRCSLKL